MTARKPYSIKRADVANPPEGIPWVWLTRELLSSPAWKRRCIHCIRFLDFLMIEHLSHAGLENGNLGATWDQLVAHGIGRRYIAAAIEEAVAFKLVAVNRGALKADKKLAMSRYRLTFYATRAVNEEGTKYWIKPGDEWRKVKDETAREFLAKRPAWNGAKNTFPSAHRVNSNSHTVKPGTQ